MDEQDQRKSKRRRFNPRQKMRSSRDEDPVQSGGVSKGLAEVKLQSNGTIDMDKNGSYPKQDSQTNGHVTLTNDVLIPVPIDMTSDHTLDTLLTAWTILTQRYQRDLFHHFTWGIKDAGADAAQCIQAHNLGLLGRKAASNLRAKISDVRMKDAPADNITIFLNDGTKDEVCLSL